MSLTSFVFNQSGVEMKSGLECKIHMKMAKDVSGTYKMVSMFGIEDFAQQTGNCEFLS